MLGLAILVVALGIEAVLGYPAWLFGVARHPVVWMGALIGRCDRQLNRPALSFAYRRINGLLALLVLLVITVGLAALVQWVVLGQFGWAAAVVLLGLLSSTLLAQRSLWRHVRDVADGLDRGGLPAGRDAVSRIVGRNPEFLDESGVVRAAIESLAENFSDAVVAPALWCAVFGLPGIVFYKAVNTADSMIGHRTERFAAFGWAAARLDDIVNLPASRLSAVWLLAAALLRRDAAVLPGWRAVWRDARHHRSHNAGWPEAAMAGALGIRIGGPRFYGDTPAPMAWMGDGREVLTVGDLRRALTLYMAACAMQFASVVALLIGVSVRG